MTDHEQHRDNSELLPSHHGLPPVSWDQDLNFTTADASGALIETSLPLPSSTSSTALDSGLIAPDNSFYNTADWNSLSLPSTGTEQFPGNVLQYGLSSGGPQFAMTCAEHIDTLAMTPNTLPSLGTSLSTPMEPSKTDPR